MSCSEARGGGYEWTGLTGGRRRNTRKRGRRRKKEKIHTRVSLAFSTLTVANHEGKPAVPARLFTAVNVKPCENNDTDRASWIVQPKIKMI